MARSIWNGVLHIGKERIAVQLSSAVQDQSVHFHLLDSHTHTRVKQHMVDPETGKEVPSDQIRKAYELQPGAFVVLEPDEVASVKPKPSRKIEILAFVPRGVITHQWYERPYYLDFSEDARPYFALAAALDKQAREGLVRWVMRGKEYLGALRVNEGRLVLIALHYAEEVLSARDLPKPSGRPIDPKEIQMAEQLVSVLKGDFDPADFRDDYRGRVLQYIEAKARGEKPKLLTIPRKRAATSLSDMLAASLRSAHKHRGKAVA